MKELTHSFSMFPFHTLKVLMANIGTKMVKLQIHCKKEYLRQFAISVTSEYYEKDRADIFFHAKSFSWSNQRQTRQGCSSNQPV